jgi:hypothetical protein
MKFKDINNINCDSIISHNNSIRDLTKIGEYTDIHVNLSNIEESLEIIISN